MNNILVSTDKSLLDIPLIHNFLKNSYWAKNIPIEIVKKSIANSFCFGVYEDGKQIGFARAITDFTTFSYLADVFIVPEKQGKGIGKFLLKSILEHDELQGLKRWHLVTKDAQNLYRKFGFQNPENPDRQMENVIKNIYSQT